MSSDDGKRKSLQVSGVYETTKGSHETSKLTRSNCVPHVVMRAACGTRKYCVQTSSSIVVRILSSSAVQDANSSRWLSCRADVGFSKSTRSKPVKQRSHPMKRHRHRNGHCVCVWGCVVCCVVVRVRVRVQKNTRKRNKKGEQKRWKQCFTG